MLKTQIKKCFSTPLRIIISSLIIAIALSLSIIFLYDVNQCTVSDFHSGNPYENTQRSFTKSGACQKAYAICTFYSSHAGDCAIKKENVK